MKLPGDASGEAVVKALTKHGWTVDRQSGSSHKCLHKDGRIITVPMHKYLKKGTLNAIISQSGIPRDDFISQL